MSRHVSRTVPIEYLGSDGAPHQTHGWKTSHALGVLYLGNGFSSVMLMTGVLVEDGFPTLAIAHRFNDFLLAEKKLAPGVDDIEEFFTRAGGRDKARAIVERVKKAALKEKPNE